VFEPGVIESLFDGTSVLQAPGNAAGEVLLV